mmetsp:Transcript_9908/g.40270  ORF Transcript_9908/g.40270 Transcript_9908/m.40270 type:complete len:85 (+) Transcript_9908:1728-1982(+)
MSVFKTKCSLRSQTLMLGVLPLMHMNKNLLNGHDITFEKIIRENTLVQRKTFTSLKHGFPRHIKNSVIRFHPGRLISLYTGFHS